MDTLATSGTPAAPASPAAVAQPAAKVDAPATPAPVKAQPEAAKDANIATGEAAKTGADAVVDPAAEVKYDLKAPEGYAANLAEVAEFAKANKISPEAAQKVLDREASVTSAAIKARDDQQLQAWEKRVGEWGDQVRADKELGGANLAKSQEATLRALKQFDTDFQVGADGKSHGAFARELNASGGGSHPAVFRFLHAIGKALAEDSFIKSTSEAPPSAEPFYPKSNMKP